MTLYVIVGLISAGLRASAPLLLATLGAILSEKSGSTNMGVEGTMGIAAVAGLAVGFYTGNVYLTLLAVILVGMLVSLIYSFLTVTLKANQLITGLSISILGGGVCNMMGALINNAAKAAKTTARLNNSVMSLYTGLDKGLVPTEGNITLGVYLDKFLDGVNFFVIIGLVLAFALNFYFKHTRSGLALRSVGENPQTADAMGINVSFYRYAASAVGGAMMGLAGLFACMNVGGKWELNLINGQGWLAVALVIFAYWNPIRAIWGSFFFGVLLRLYLHVKLPFLPSYCEPFLMMLPYIVTIVALVISCRKNSKHDAAPAACGSNFFREER